MEAMIAKLKVEQQRKLEEIAKTGYSIEMEYLKGYICALSVVEGMLAEAKNEAIHE